MREWKRANPERTKAINTQPSKESKERYRKSDRGMEVCRQKAIRHYHKDEEASRARNRELYAARLGRPVRVPMSPAEVKEASREKTRRYYHKDIEASRIRSRQAYAADPDKHIQKVVARSKRVRHATPPWADRDAIAAIYKRARQLTRETGIPHHVDHEYPLRGRTVNGLHVETNLQVVPAWINRSKSNHVL